RSCGFPGNSFAAAACERKTGLARRRPDRDLRQRREALEESRDLGGGGGGLLGAVDLDEGVGALGEGGRGGGGGRTPGVAGGALGDVEVLDGAGPQLAA